MEAHIIEKALTDARNAVERAIDKIQDEFTYGDEQDEAIARWCEAVRLRLDSAVWDAIKSESLV